jgi:hypothetical protein
MDIAFQRLTRGKGQVTSEKDSLERKTLNERDDLDSESHCPGSIHVGADVRVCDCLRKGVKRNHVVTRCCRDAAVVRLPDGRTAAS